MLYLLLDTNIVLDYLIDERPNHQKIETFLKNNKKKVKYLIASYQYDTIHYISKRLIKNEDYKQKISTFLKEFNINIISTSGKDNINAEKYEDIEDGLLISICERIGKDNFILSFDKGLLKTYDRAISPEEFNIKESNIPLLNLTLQYLQNAEDLEDALLTTGVRANYILGEPVKQLEEKVADFIETKYAIGCSSGTEALVLSLRALAIKLKGQEYFDKTDEIITTPFTFTATGDVILRAGATPVFVDIDPSTYNISPENIRKYLDNHNSSSSDSRVVGIIPVHLYGHPCNIDDLVRIAKENDLFIVEDCAQSFGAKWNGKQTGSFGIAGCFSFFPSKNLGGFGDGGMISTNDYEIAALARMLLKHGGKDKYNVDHIGYNARLDTIQAAIILPKLQYIDEFNELRRKIAKTYSSELADIKEIVLPDIEQDSIYHVCHQYTIRLSDGRRDELQKYLMNNGISSMVYYPYPLHKMRVFGNGRSISFGSLENAEAASSEVLSLPIEPLQSEDTTKRVIMKIREFFGK